MVSLQHHCGEDCTILVSNSSNKFRLQGSSFAALWVPMAALVQRVKDYFRGDAVMVHLEEELPLPWYFECIDSHFALRQQRQVLLGHLEQAAAQVCCPSFHWHVRRCAMRPGASTSLEALRCSFALFKKRCYYDSRRTSQPHQVACRHCWKRHTKKCASLRTQ